MNTAVAQSAPPAGSRLHTSASLRSQFRFSTVAVPLLALVFVVVIGAAIPNMPGQLRLMFAAASLLALFAIAEWDVDAAVVTAFLYLCFLALARRLLLGAAPWSLNDPLLLVTPVFAGWLCVKSYVLKREAIFTDRITTILAALLAFTLLQTLNPHNGGLSAGLGGLIFLAVPLMWFLVGCHMVGSRAVRGLLGAVVFAGVVASLYGIVQMEFGFPWWDQAWIDLGGYSSLSVGDETIRAFGMFPSAGEYASIIGVALVVCVAYSTYGHLIALIPVPLLTYCVFMASARGVVVKVVAALIVMLCIRYSSKRRFPLVLVACLIVFMLAAPKISTMLESHATNANNSLVSHQLEGLANPLDEEDSTLIVHLDLMIEGIKSGFTDPIGQGTAVTNLSSKRLPFEPGEQGRQATEVDISDAFVAEGLIGGILFFAFVVGMLAVLGKNFFNERTASNLAILGVAVCALGAWWNGGMYSFATMLWVLLGAGVALSRSLGGASRESTS